MTIASKKADSSQRALWVLTAWCAAISGCVTTTHIVGQANRPTPQLQTTVSGAKTYSDPGPVSADDAVGTDPCEMRLQNIEAALLLYYSLNHDLPPRLEDLVSLSSDDLPLNCPVSRQAYLYIKEGMAAAGNKERIIVADPTPAHSGKRWCIFMSDPTPGGALELEPREIPDSVFRAYVSR